MNDQLNNNIKPENMEELFIITPGQRHEKIIS